MPLCRPSLLCHCQYIFIGCDNSIIVPGCRNNVIVANNGNIGEQNYVYFVSAVACIDGPAE